MTQTVLVVRKESYDRFDDNISGGLKRIPLMCWALTIVKVRIACFCDSTMSPCK